jgi:hypothetical protein
MPPKKTVKKYSIETISIKDAFVLWYGDNYDNHLYEIFLEMKKYNCYDIFSTNGLICCDSKYINLNNETINQEYFMELMQTFEGKRKIPIKNIWFNELINLDVCQLMHPYNNGTDDHGHVSYQI